MSAGSGANRVISLRDLVAAVARSTEQIKVSVQAVARSTEQVKDAVEALNRDLGQAINDVNHEVRGEIHDLSEYLDDIDYNHRTRLRNGVIRRPEQVIRPLKNLYTGRFVELPNTLGELNALDEIEVENYLLQLGQSPIGSAEENMTRLKEFIGIIWEG